MDIGVLNIQDVIPLDELFELMPNEFNFADENRCDLDENPQIGWTRISAFDKWATCFEDLEEWIDRAPEVTILQYRARFREFLNAIVGHAICFGHFYRSESKTSVRRLFAQDEDLATLSNALVEQSAVDIYLPECGVLFSGHDGFGFTLYFVITQEISRDWVIAQANRSGLFSVKPG